ncbi:MAG: hypothetical protein M1491_04045 [Deltaproteobacteria bacterium]|nr:hypothetical protein [Deltaproteobacteria bacterium]
MDNEIVKNLILPVSLAAGSFIAGLIFEKVILERLKKLALKTRWKGGDLIADALNEYIMLWFILGGVMIAAENLPLKNANIEIIDKVLIVVFILSTTIVLSRILTGMVELSIRSTKSAFPSSSIFTNLTKVIVFLIGGLIRIDKVGRFAEQ